ncbi:hypothetical protein, partial [Klebsiella pneumoniae]|uniref:hypothetical protein n=1 Tax=Klebsiella pneumoniae TaxID=573 RepID=UPI003A811D7A
MKLKRLLFIKFFRNENENNENSLYEGIRKRLKVVFFFFVFISSMPCIGALLPRLPNWAESYATQVSSRQEAVQHRF